MQISQVLHLERTYCFPRSENRVAVGVIGPKGRSVQIEHEIVRGILYSADLFQDHAAFEFEIRVSQYGVPNQVCKHVEGAG